jgi:cholesterol transport system auxiliary component
VTARRLRAHLVLVGCAALAGCSGFLHSTAPPEQTYYLRVTTPPVTAAPPTTAQALRVESPGAVPGLDSTHIVLLQPDNRLSFYTGSRWPASAPVLIESLAVQALRDSAHFSSVEGAGSPFPADYLLQITLRRFEADYSAGSAAPEVHVSLDCIIGRRDARDVVGTFTAQGTATASANRMSEVVAAFEQATNAALASLTQQAAQSVRDAAITGRQNPVNPAPSSSRESQ